MSWDRPGQRRAHARPLGQHRRPPGDGPGGARVRGRLDLLGRRAGARRPVPRRAVRAAARVGRDQCRRTEQRQRARGRGAAAHGPPRRRRTAGRRVPAARHPGVSVGEASRRPSPSAAWRRPIRSTPTCSGGGRRPAARVYETIPDFGGFVVKADSEGQPGPLRTAATTPTARTAGPGPGAVRRDGVLARLRLRPPPGLARPVHRPRPGRLRPLHAAGRPLRRQRRPPGQVRPDGLPDARARLPRGRRDAADPAGRRAAGDAGVHRAAAARGVPRCVARSCGSAAGTAVACMSPSAVGTVSTSRPARRRQGRDRPSVPADHAASRRAGVSRSRTVRSDAGTKRR